jgi:hypothetical protein
MGRSLAPVSMLQLRMAQVCSELVATLPASASASVTLLGSASLAMIVSHRVGRMQFAGAGAPRAGGTDTGATEWNDQEGSNEREVSSPRMAAYNRDSEGSNPASDDGGGAGSDNRNSVAECNASDKQGAVYRQPGPEAHCGLSGGETAHALAALHPRRDGQGDDQCGQDTPVRSDEDDADGLDPKPMSGPDGASGGGSNDASKRSSMPFSTCGGSNVRSGGTAGSANAKVTSRQVPGSVDPTASPVLQGVNCSLAPDALDYAAGCS